MYTLSSLKPMPLSLSEMLVSGSSPLLPVKQSPYDSIQCRNVCFATSAENCCVCHAYGGGDGGNGGGVWWFSARQRETVINDWKLPSHIGNDSQEMPQGHDYQDFLKKNLNKADLIRVLNEFLKREVLRLHLDYSLVITLEKKSWEISLSGVQNLSP